MRRKGTLVEPRNYYCPQCGYDLRGQAVQRCSECGFHYDLPALRALAWDAFYAAYYPYMRAAKILAPACCLGCGVLAAQTLFFILFIIMVFILDPILETWILGSVRRDLREIEWWFSSPRAGYGIFLLIHHALAPIITVIAILLGMFWAIRGLCNTEPNVLLSATPVQLAILERARWVARVLFAIACLILLTLLLCFY